jgi:hypothetical protein
MRVKAPFLVLTTAFCLAAPPLAGQTMSPDAPRSAALVKQLVAAMQTLRLDAIATPDPADPDRVVAALAYPGVQLLVASAAHESLPYLKMQITKRQYRDVYEELQRGVPASRLFFHDMGCDGLGNADNIDIVYEGSSGRTLLDGNWEAQSLTEAAYAEKRNAAEEKYVHALTVLLDAARKLMTEP